MKSIHLARMLALCVASLLTTVATQASVITTVSEAYANNNSDSNPNLTAAWLGSGFSTTNDVLIGLTSGTGGVTAVGGGSGFTPSVAHSESDFPVANDGAAPTLPLGSADDFTHHGMFTSVGNNGNPNDTNSGGQSLTYNFASGLVLNDIKYIGGWQDSGRDAQAFTVAYSTDFGLTYTNYLVNFTNNPSNPNGNFADSTLVDITDSTGTIGNGAAITNLRFTFNTVENGYVGLEELAAYTAAPEPSTIALGLSGALVLGLCLFRRRLA